MSLNIGQRILIVLALAMLVWYVLGLAYNRRKSIYALSWLREGLALLGGQTQAAWIGSAASGAQVIVVKANPPFRELEATFLLESRELLPWWLVSLLRGRRDELTIRAQLRSPGRGEVQVVPAGSRLERSLRQADQGTWSWQTGPRSLLFAYRGKQSQAVMAALAPFLEEYGSALYHLVLRRGKPHLLLRARLKAVVEYPSAEFFDNLAAALAPMADAA